VVVGAHLDSWDLASGTTDNGTGSCVVLEVARALATLARQGYPPKRTIRFVLFSGEEQGLHGSRHYVQRYKNELPRHSAAIVHDTGTGRVYGLACYRSQDGRSPGFNGAVSCSVSPERVVLFAKYLAERSVLAFI
jgi:Zn-dependent M28 family amino/carboxypeptidase